MVLPFLSQLSYDLQDFFLSQWLDIRSISNIDVALSSHDWRPHWLALLCTITATSIDNWGHSLSSLIWLTRRGIRVRRMEIKVDAWQIRGCHLLVLKKTDLTHIGLSGCIDITDACILNIAHECRKLIGIDLSECKGFTNEGISALGHGCGQLQSINLRQCNEVTDIGMSALGVGCGQLQIINLSYCDKLTDIGISALGVGCRQLQSIDLAFCHKVTDIGISALSAGCGQLQNIDLTGCGKVTNGDRLSLRIKKKEPAIYS